MENKSSIFIGKGGDILERAFRERFAKANAEIEQTRIIRERKEAIDEFLEKNPHSFYSDEKFEKLGARERIKEHHRCMGSLYFLAGVHSPWLEQVLEIDKKI